MKPVDEHRQTLVERHAERGYRTQPLKRDDAPAAVTSLLAGLLKKTAPAREERGAA